MDVKYQILFFFSALGAFNGFFLTGYFAFFVKNRNRATYFLSALLLVICVRVTKSVFLIYDPGISNLFIEVGLTACALIGPFLYLYIKESTEGEKGKAGSWLFHILPILIAMICIGYFYPYKEYRPLWQQTSQGIFCWSLYSIWLTYIILSLIRLKDAFLRLFSKTEKASDLDIWLINITLGVAIIWLAYFTNRYTSYIVGALSFSFIFYLMMLLWVFKRRKANIFFQTQVKYANKKISSEESKALDSRLVEIFREKELYKNPDLKLSELAEHLEVSSSYLSQYLNDNLGKSFSILINEYRIDAAEAMLKANDLLTLEAIGQECGFKSNSSFYSAFKKFKGITPGKLKKTLD